MSTAEDTSGGVHRTRLFAGTCLALVPTGASFALIANILGQLKTEFILSNAQVGLIAGTSLGSMAIALLILGPALEGYGFKRGMLMAFLGHFLGVTTFISAALFTGSPTVGFWVLMLGAVFLAIGNGMIEVVGNPLTAALYPKDKTTKLNWFHAFFPLGITAGAVLGYFMAQYGVRWTWQLGLIYIPVVIYGYLALPQKFPKTETAEAGIPYMDLVRYTFTHPLFILLLFMKMITVSVELAPMRWVEVFLGQLGIPGILVVAWISIVMVVLRFFSGHFVARISPPGMILFGAICTGGSLFLLSYVNNTIAAFAVATFFGAGVAFFFPTMLGIVSERLPRTGSLGIVLMAGTGLLIAGFVGTPAMGLIADRQISQHMQAETPEEPIAILQSARAALPRLIEEADGADFELLATLGYRASDARAVLDAVDAALLDYEQQGEIRGDAIPNALRALIGGGVPLDDEINRANALLSPAEAAGFQEAFRSVAPLTLILILVFGAMYLNDRRKGGYRIESLAQSSGH